MAADGADPQPRLVYQHPRYNVLIEVEEADPLPPGPAEVILQRGASTISSVCTLCNTAIGSGVLALPYAFYCTGLVGCLIMYAVVAVLEAFTMYVLAKMAERYHVRSYASLVRRALGRKTGGLLAAVTIVYLWGSSVSYLIIAADTFTNISELHLGPDALTSQRHVILALAGVLVLVMSFPRNLQALDRVSAAAVIGFIYTVVAVMIRGLQAAKARPDPWADVKLFNSDWHALYAVSIVVFGLNCHANVIGVFHELDHKPDRIISTLPANPHDFHRLGSFAPKPYTHKLIGMLGAIIVYMFIILAGYICIGISGYLAFPTNIDSNVLNSFPSDDVLIQAARAVIGCVVIGSYPLNHHPGRLAFEDLLDAVADIRETPAWACHTFTACFVASTVGVALVVQDLGIVVHWVGGTVASFMIFCLPGVLLMNAAIIKYTKRTGVAARLQAEEQQAADEGPDAAAEEEAGASSSVRSSLMAPSWSFPLLGKKAGIREAGLIFAPGKSWIAGLCLVVISVLVLAVTVATGG